MHERQRRLDPLVGEVGEELAELRRGEHALVDERAARQRREVRPRCSAVRARARCACGRRTLAVEVDARWRPPGRRRTAGGSSGIDARGRWRRASTASTGTSRQPSTAQALVGDDRLDRARSPCSASSVVGRQERDARRRRRPPAGSSKSTTARRKRSGIWMRMPAPSPVFDLGARTRRGGRGCTARRAPCATMSWLGATLACRRRTTTPQESCSKRGSYSPNASGTLLNGSRGGAGEFWAFVISHPGVHTKVLAVDAEGRRWPGCGGSSLPGGLSPTKLNAAPAPPFRAGNLPDHVATRALGPPRPDRPPGGRRARRWRRWSSPSSTTVAPRSMPAGTRSGRRCASGTRSWRMRRTAFAAAGGGDRSVTTDLGKALSDWTKATEAKDPAAEAAAANRLEAQAMRLRTNAGAPRFTGVPELGAAIGNFTGQLVPAEQVQAYNRAVDRYQDERRSTLGVPVALGAGVRRTPVLVGGIRRPDRSWCPRFGAATRLCAWAAPGPSSAPSSPRPGDGLAPTSRTASSSVCRCS